MQYFSFMFSFFARSLFFSCFVLQCSSSSAKSYESINFTRKKFVFTVVENLIQKVSFLQFLLSQGKTFYHWGKTFYHYGKKQFGGKMFWQFRLEMRLFGDIFKQCVFHATNLSRRTIRCLRHIHKFWSSNFSSRENAKVNKLCPTAYYQSRAAAKLDFHFLLTLAAAWTNKANIVAADNIGILCKKM